MKGQTGVSPERVDSVGYASGYEHLADELRLLTADIRSQPKKYLKFSFF